MAWKAMLRSTGFQPVTICRPILAVRVSEGCLFGSSWPGRPCYVAYLFPISRKSSVICSPPSFTLPSLSFRKTKNVESKRNAATASS